MQPHNPDVLMCIANLSNDEVFTPPEFVNQMLDTLADLWAVANSGASIWTDKEVTFLDPCTKSGVFLREITKRLTVGPEKQIPDLTERVNHILTKQVYGIAITELTSLLARRSVYAALGQEGDLNFMIKHQPNVLFVFNDNEEEFRTHFDDPPNPYGGTRQRLSTR